ncbi:oligosaccharide flippase family protein [Candidatus Daviesbacteria bacterium]|nr:oligosaccharide flippase family protein [Candidatus Daviesbacteria bacterium]
MSFNSSDGEITYEKIKERAIKGVAFLTGRNFLLQAITQISFFLLTIFLSPSQFGVFFLVSTVINFFAYFSDIGLAAALIQRKDKVAQDDLKTVFTVQQVLVLLTIAIIFILTPFFQNWYKLSQEGVYLIWALAISLLFSSLKTIPTVLLERQLSFGKSVLPQIVETIAFYATAVVLAFKGFGVTSFTVAVLLRGISGLLSIYLIQPWQPGFAISKKSLQSLLRFGVPYQLNTFLALVKDDGLIMFLGGVLGTSGMGFLGWAQKWGFAPLRFFMDQIIKVTFPAFSRLQHDKEKLSNAVSKSILFVSLMVFPSVVGLVVLAPLLTTVIPKYEKWQPALVALSLFGFNAMWAAVTTPLTNTLNAIGKIQLTFRLMMMWTILTWVFIPLLAINYGINGAALGFALVGLSSVIAIAVALKYVEIDLTKSVIKPLISSLVMGIVLFYVSSMLSPTLLSVFILLALGIVIYILQILLFLRDEVAQGLRQLINIIKVKEVS